MNYRQNEAHDLIEQALTKTRKATLWEVLVLLNEQSDQIRRLLDNGRPIYVQAFGKRFDRLHICRAMLWSKLGALNKAKSTIIDLLSR